MAAYTGIQGQNILIVSSDPANPTEGQIWYNSTSNLLKGYQNVVVGAAWASRWKFKYSKRWISQHQELKLLLLVQFGGSTAPNAIVTTGTESYNGTSWTTSVNSANIQH